MFGEECAIEQGNRGVDLIGNRSAIMRLTGELEEARAEGLKLRTQIREANRV